MFNVYLLVYRNFSDAEEILTAALKKTEERFGMLHFMVILNERNGLV